MSNYDVFTWGASESNECGHRSGKDELMPKVILPLHKTGVVQVACGVGCSAAVTGALR